MIATDEDALICDFAETYHIFDYKQLPIPLAAVFACGLHDDARIMLRMSGQTVSIETLLTAQITDGINLLLWTKTEDAEKGKNRPNSIVASLMGESGSKTDDGGYDSGADFERARQMLLNKGGDS
jgi:hypothetical protein